MKNSSRWSNNSASVSLRQPSESLERTAHEDLVADVLAGYAPEYIVLAKYMRILSPKFVARYPNRMINIHHSFLPAFIGAKPYHQAHERGVKIIGATAHIVTDDLDTGPIIARGVIPVNHTRTGGGDGAGGARRRENRARESSQARARRAGVFARQSDDHFRIAVFHAQGRLVGFHLSFVLAVANAYALDSLYSRQSLLLALFSAARAPTMRSPGAGDGMDVDRTCDYRTEFSRNLRHRQKGLLRSFHNRARYAFTGQDGRADRAEDGWHDGGHAASKRRPISALCARQTSLECISGAAK